MKSRQNNILAAFRNRPNASWSKNPTFSTNRRVSTTRTCERSAIASFPCIVPMGMRRGCWRGDVVRGTTIQVSAPNPRMTTTGRRKNFPLPSCSEPIFTPSRHHHTSRTVYKRGCSACVCFFLLFQLSKFFPFVCN